MTSSGRRRTWPLAGLIVALAALVVAVAVALSQGGTRAPDGGAPEPTGRSAAAIPTGALRMAVVGDSISFGDSRDFAGGDLGRLSWVPWAVGDDLVFAGGWAQIGARTELMATQVQPYDADVLVILAGTNDLAFGVPPAETAAHLATIAETAGVPRVVLVGIPPNDIAGPAVTRFNAELERVAEDNGWEFADASARLRTDDDRFREGMTLDGVHPTIEGAQLLGAAIRDHLLG